MSNTIDESRVCLSHGMGFFLLPIPAFLTWLVLLPASSYGLAFLQLQKGSPLLRPTQRETLMVLHLLFVLDVASTLWLLKRTKSLLPELPPTPPESPAP